MSILITSGLKAVLIMAISLSRIIPVTATGVVILENIEVNSERAVLLYSYNNLLTYPWLNEAVNEKSLAIHAWWFDLKSVMLWKKAQETDSFMPLRF